MSDQGLSKEEHIRLSRLMCLLLNRAMMYKADHPHVIDAVLKLHGVLTEHLPALSSLAIIMNREQLFIDEEPVDPRVNTGRIVAMFKKTGMQSISFLAGITNEDLQVLVKILTEPEQYNNCDKMIEELNSRGVRNLKINHVFYKKMTRDDEIVSRLDQQAKKSPITGETDPGLSRQFMKMLMEGLLTEETEKALSMKKLMADPAGIAQNMLNAEDRSMQAAAGGAAAEQAGENDGKLAPGDMLLYQIQTLSDDVSQKIEAGDQDNMIDVADAVSEMKRQLSLGIEAQKTLNKAYANEEKILGQMDELTDNVVIKLIRNEYQQGKITTVRLAQILRRLVPEAKGLKRLLPKIKTALLAEGMPMADYLQLVQQLGKELESEELSHVLQEAAESVGVDGEELIEEILKKPERAAELMAIAAEIRKGTGDENAFTEMLINYVEQLGAKIHTESDGAETPEKDAQDRQMMADVGSGLIAQLKNMNLSDQALLGMEERINARIESVFGKFAADSALLAQAQTEPPRPEKTLLQMMEQGTGNNEELKEVLRAIRSQADAGQIDENNFEQIHTELIDHEKAFREKEAKKHLPPGVLKTREFKSYLKKELLRAKRHNLPLSTLSFTLLKVRLHDHCQGDGQIKKAEVMESAYRKLVNSTRTSDIIGELNQDVIAMILPMTDNANADLALQRISKLLQEYPLEVRGLRLYIIVAGSVVSFLPSMKPDADLLIRAMNYELEHATAKIKTRRST